MAHRKIRGTEGKDTVPHSIKWLPGLLVVLVTASCATQRITPQTATPEPQPLPVTTAPLLDIPLSERLGSLGALPLPGSSQGPSNYSFHAVGVPLADALRLFARDNRINIVIDPGIEGELTVDFEGIPLAAAMDAILEAHGFPWEQKQGLIRVYRQLTRTFEVDYLRMLREGRAVTDSGKFGLTSGGEGESSNDQTSEYSVRYNNPVDFWQELEVQLKDLVGKDGRFQTNRTAGMVTVTTSGDRMREVEQYLAATHQGTLRQVRIEARILEIRLDNRHRLGIDWSAPNLAQFGKFRVGADLLSTGNVLFDDASAPGPRDVFLGADGSRSSTLLVRGEGEGLAVLNALSEQGDLNIVSQPHLTALNNQTAQIRVATETPYFVQTSSELRGVPGVTPDQPAQFEQRTASVGLVLQVTPQISKDNWIALEIVPVITREVGRVPNPDPAFDPTSGPLILDVKQTAVLARVRSGETVVLGGLIQDDTRENVQKVPLLGDLPMIGGLFRDRTDSNAKTELVVFVTPVAEYPETAAADTDW